MSHGIEPSGQRNRPVGHRQWRTALSVAAVGVVGAAAVGVGFGWRHGPVWAADEAVSKTAEPAAVSGPVRLPPYTLPAPLFEPSTVAAAIDRLRITKPTTVSTLLHAARLFGLDMPVRVRAGRPEMAPFRELLFDEAKGREAFSDEPALIGTRTGIRSRVVVKRDSYRQPARQAHEGQLLAVIGEQGIHPDTPVVVETGRFAIRDLVADTAANFNLDDDEIEWAAVGLSLYLPPQASWADKFGRRTTFDDLARKLMKTPFDQPGIACQGTHLLHALAVIYGADQQRPVLSPEARAEVRAYLARYVREAVETQRLTGEWWGGWYETDRGQGMNRFINPGTHTRLAVTVTGHHLEWMLILPPDLRPPDEVFRRAGRWLHAALLKAPEREIEEGYCPYSHAGYVVKVLSTPNRPGRD